MTLRRRTGWFVVIVLVVPVAIAALLATVDRRRTTSSQIERAAAAQAREQADAALTVAGQRLEAIGADLEAQAELLDARGVAAQVTAGQRGAARRWLKAQLAAPPASARADFLVLVRRDRTLLEDAWTPDAVGVSARADEIAAAVTGPPPPGLLVHTRALWVGDDFVGWLMAGVELDDELLRSWPVDDVAVVERGQVVASTTPVPADLMADLTVPPVRSDTSIGPGAFALATTTVDPDRHLVAWRPPAAGPITRPGITAALVLAWLLLVVWAIAGVWLASRAVQRTVGGPVMRAAGVLRQALDGRADHRMAVAGPPEVRTLGTAVNEVAAELDRRARAVADGREQLRGALSRLGETLSSSLNLDRTLAVVVDTAMDTVQADTATLVLTTEDDDLDIRIDRGFDLPADTRFGDASLPGWVVRTGLSVRLPADRVIISPAVEGGILAHHQLSVPVSGTATGGHIGALLLGRADQGPAFTEEDLRTVRAFAQQAGVAIENVLVHQEARRLSLTDPLTELWNFRYFQLQALREVEAASRYDRPLGLLIVDLDHFKRVNDRHGHPVGDQVLSEVARRIRTSTRLPDIVARYGGEEFVLLLPGTDIAGAVVTAERIRRRVSRLPIVAGGQDALRISVTCSVGVAAHPLHGATVDDLLRRADAALYTAKSQGRDRVVSADDVGTEVTAPAGGRDRRYVAH